MAIYEYIKLDHEYVSHLFKLFQKTDLPERRKQIVDLISKELLPHLQSEEESFYAVLENSDVDEIKHSKEEHKDIENQMRLIQETKRIDAHWVKKVERLKEMVEHHVHEEENKLFDQAKQIFSKAEANSLKEQMHYLKMNLILSGKNK